MKTLKLTFLLATSKAMFCVCVCVYIRSYMRCHITQTHAFRRGYKRDFDELWNQKLT